MARKLMGAVGVPGFIRLLLLGAVAMVSCTAAERATTQTMLAPTPSALPAASPTPRNVPPTAAASITATPTAQGLPAAGATATGTTGARSAAQQVAAQVTVVATGLDTPWALAFAPDSRLFFTERPGLVRLIENGRLRDQPVATLPVRETSEGGLMGLALDPSFPADPYLYAMYTYAGAQGIRNRVVRLRLEGGTAREDKTLLDNLPAGTIHDGGRVKFGPDRLLYVTIGETGNAGLAQDSSSLAGKILRLNRDGTVPTGNPFPGSYVYTLGHRNPQGIAWQPDTGRFYETEHGSVGNDEVNLIEAGQNYGWPVAQGAGHPAPYRAPIVTYSPSIAPSGATFYDGAAIPQWRGSLFFTTLAGTHLHRLVFDQADPGRVLADERLYQNEYGRLRDVVEGPDGALYVATSNRDGRGRPAADDDRILRLAPR